MDLAPLPPGTGDLPTTYGSGTSYIELGGGGDSYTIRPENVGQTLSVWGFYWTNTGAQKWVCRQASSIRGNPSLPTVSVRRSGRSRVPAKENAEFTLTRTNHNLSSALTVQLQNKETWEEGGETKVYTGRFSKTIPANETQISFTRTTCCERTLTVKVTH